MINKQIFFYWFGKNKPEYVDWTISIYKEVNPTWKIDLIEVPSVDNIENEDFLEMAKIIRKEVYLKGFSEAMEEHINHKWNISNLISKRAMSYIGDLLRHYLLFKYGGICMDSDTFPAKPFDDELINLIDDRYKFITPKKDEYFCFAEKGYISLCFTEKPSFYKSIPNVNMKASPRFSEYKERFLKCDLKYGEHLYPVKQEDYKKWEWKYYKYYYFDHYFVRSWKQPTQEDIEEREKFYKFLKII